jgi:type I restriction enzyme, S subunit
MTAVQHLITDHLDLWTTAIKHKSSAGRGSNKKIELYGIKKLRELILELAVRGLLVPQDPSDEPASELLKKIAAEKTKLIKAGQLKKQKPLPPISDEKKPFALPKGWEWSRLGDTGIGATGKTPNTKEPSYFDGDIPFIGPGQITLDGKLLVSDKYLSETGLKNSEEALADDLLMVCIGGSIGKSVISDRRLAFNQQINAIRPLLILPKYLLASVSTGIFYKSVIDNASGSATPIINRSKWEALIIPVCPLPEQLRIVAKVDELMQLCDRLERQTESSINAHQVLVEQLLTAITKPEATDSATALELLFVNFDSLFTTAHSIDQLKQSILQLAVMGKLVPQDPNDEPASELLKKIAAEKTKLIKAGQLKKQKPLPPISDEEKPFALPKGWEWSRLGDTGIGATGKTPNTKEPSYFDGNIPFIGPGQITLDGKLLVSDKYLSETGLKNSEEALAGDLLMVCIGGSIGKSVISDRRLAFNQQINAIRPLLILPKYLSASVSTGIFYKSVIDNASGSATPIINRSKWEALIIPVCPLPEQLRIVAKVDLLMKLCDRLQENLTNAQNTQLLLADALAEQALAV